MLCCHLYLCNPVGFNDFVTEKQYIVLQMQIPSMKMILVSV